MTWEWTSRRLAEAGVGLGSTLAEAAASLPRGAYTTLRTYPGERVLRLAAHVARLQESARLMGAGGRLMAAEVRAAVAAAVQASGGGLRRLRLTWSPPRLFVSSEPFAPPAPELLEGGVVCATLELVRSDPRAKDSGFSSVAAEAHARLPPGVHEGLLVDRGGVILEGLSSNFFAIAGRELRTEGPRALAGVTRSLVLEAARGHLTPVERGVSLAELSRVVEECFLTSASRGILPVVRVDATVVGQGVPGPLTRELRARFDALVERELEPVQ